MSDERDAAPRRPVDHIDPAEIAAWLDEPDDLTVEDRATIEEHLAGCVECRQVASELRALSAALAELPEASLPRSFALTAEQARPVPAIQRAPIPIRRSSRWRDRQIAALRWATAAAAILFVVVLSVDLVTTRFDRPRVDNTMAISSSDQAGAAGGAAPAEASPESLAAKAADSSPAEASSEAAASEAGATAAAGDTAMMATAPTATGEREAQQAPVTSQREERLRMLEFGLATVFVCLLALMIVLPRWWRRAGNHS